MKISVDSCWNCPLFDEDESCSLEWVKGAHKSYFNESPPPKDCPLRVGPVTIRLKEKS